MKRIYSLLIIAIVLLSTMMLTACPWDDPQPSEHVHTFTDTVIEPTCSSEGYTLHTCDECGYAKEDSFVPSDPDAHGFVKVETVEATCTEDGYIRYECEYDHTHEEYQVLEAGHKLSAYVVIVAPTCQDYGKERAFCENCQYFEDRGVAPTHNYIVIDVVEPTCSSEGYTVEKCSACESERKVNYVGKSDHLWTDWITVSEGDCTTLGTKKHICIVCEEEEFGYAGYGHKYSTAVTAPTCTEPGYTTYSCTICGHSEDGDYTPAQHAWGEWKTKVNPSCQTPGIESRACSACGKAEEQLVPSQHVYDNVTVVEPTNTKSGYTVYACDCGDYYIDNYVPAIYSDLEYNTRTYWDYISGTYITEYIVASIGNGKDIKDIVIPAEMDGIKVTTIAYQAFYDCDSIEKVYLTNSITKFDVAAFWHCDNLTEFHFDGTVEEWNAINKGANWDRGLDGYTVYCNDGEITK